MSVTTIFLIAKNTIYKEWRSKALIVLMVLTIACIFLMGSIVTLMKDSLSVSQGMDFIGDKSMSLFFVFVNFWSVFMATYFGISTIASDRESGVTVQLLSFPMSRFEYIVGRILGCLSVVLLYYIISAVLGMSGLSLSAGVFVGGTEFMWSILIGLMVWLVSVTFAILFSIYLGKLPSFIAIFFANGMIWSANSYFGQNSFSEAFTNFNITKVIGAFIYALYPHVNYWNSVFDAKAISGNNVEVTIFEVAHYGFSYLLLLSLTWFCFKKRAL